MRVQINGEGTAYPNENGKAFQVGKNYKLTAIPANHWLFSNWVATGGQDFVSTNQVLTFTMTSNLVLQANFVTNVFLAAQGNYRGLFAPLGLARQQSDSGSFLFTVTTTGALSGNLDLGDGKPASFSGQFGLSGTASIVPKAEPSLTVTLQLNSADQSVSGTVSDSTFTATLTGYRDVFCDTNKATNFAGQYTFIIPGTTNPAIAPFGTGYGTVKVDAMGSVTMAGSLADGTTIGQSSAISQNGYWPLYVNLYGGKGSLWGWSLFTNQTLTAPSGVSWINETNSSKAAVYRSGFTNQQAMLTGGVYVPSQSLPAGLSATLEESNGVVIQEKLTLKTNVATGLISGSFAYPGSSKPAVKFNGVILQSQTNAQGYFLGTNQSGIFTLGAP